VSQVNHQIRLAAPARRARGGRDGELTTEAVPVPGQPGEFRGSRSSICTVDPAMLRGTNAGYSTGAPSPPSAR